MEILGPMLGGMLKRFGKNTLPVAGGAIASLMRGGAEIGALTLTRWYAMHVIVLPAMTAALSRAAGLGEAAFPARFRRFAGA